MADWLRKRIRTGSLAAGEHLPTRDELAATFDLSEPTVRQAPGPRRSPAERPAQRPPAGGAANSRAERRCPRQTGSSPGWSSRAHRLRPCVPNVHPVDLPRAIKPVKGALPRYGRRQSEGAP
ncbi:GntR family transcriptional regulator [Amycolatopsis sp. SID8362]|uniref:GntR family transcriptional regulator n=1 Tax=Amycolatopsis sp. SID8362 TaxID=2690346 RepID=UPI00136ABBDF|nr:GntR family transcriptional regulator [Amycolatopsis sp. SID8362]NED42330.1 GntR family transcriptional regulator [Amycolatopsis sp. SID8362]